MTSLTTQHQSTDLRELARWPSVLPVVLAVVAGGVLLWGRSYPGFPFSSAFIALAASAVALVVAMRPRPGGRRTMAMLTTSLALFAAAILLFATAYQGIPYSTPLFALAASVVAFVVALRPSPRGRRSVAALVAVVLVIGSGVVGTRLVGHSLLHMRWSASASEFEAVVAALPTPQVFSADRSASFRPFPSSDCPAMIGQMPIDGCRSLNGGYLFLQAPDAITDDSGIVYLPGGNDPMTAGLSLADVTALGGSWWSWTCHC